MGNSILLQTALALPNPDIEALIQGRNDSSYASDVSESGADICFVSS